MPGEFGDRIISFNLGVLEYWSAGIMAKCL